MAGLFDKKAAIGWRSIIAQSSMNIKNTPSPKVTERSQDLEIAEQKGPTLDLRNGDMITCGFRGIFGRSKRKALKVRTSGNPEYKPTTTIFVPFRPLSPP
jgi:hypothetical protein